MVAPTAESHPVLASSLAIDRGRGSGDAACAESPASAEPSAGSSESHATLDGRQHAEGILASIDLFARLPHQHITMLAESLETRQLPADHVIGAPAAAGPFFASPAAMCAKFR